MSKFNDIPIGLNKRYLIKMNGNPFAGYDTEKEAGDFISMQKSKKCKGSEAYAAKQTWTIEDRGTRG